MSSQDDMLIRYFKGKSTEEEKQQLLALMESDEAFQKYALQVKAETSIATILSQENLEQSIKARGFDHIYQKKSSTTKSKVAIFLLLLIGLAAYFFMKKNEELSLPEVQEIYAVNFINTRSVMPENSEFREIEGIILERRKNQYQSSLDLLENIPSEDSTFIRAKYLEGHLYFLKGEFHDATLAFEQVQLGQERSLYDLAKWYQALAHIGAGEADVASRLLEDLASSESAISKKATRLLKDF